MDLVRRKTLFQICRSKEELRDWVHVFLNLEMPGAVVDQDSNVSILDMAWNCYAHFTGQIPDPPTRVLYYGCRDGGKTLTQSVIEVLALLHLDVSIVHLAAIEEQSKNAQKYLKRFLNFPDFRGFVFGDNKRETAVQLYRPIDPNGVVLNSKEYRSLSESEQKGYYLVENRAEIVVATVQSTNGKHSGILCVDGSTVLQKEAPEGNKRDRKWTTARGLFRSMQGLDPGGRSGGEIEEVVVPDNETHRLLSMNPGTGDLEFVPVVRAQRTKQSTLNIVTSGRTKDGKRSLICTPSHPCLVLGRGYVMAEEIAVGDKLIVLGKSHTKKVPVKIRGTEKQRRTYEEADLSPDDRWDQVVLGSILGDAGIYQRPSQNPYLQEQHCLAQGNYLLWKRQILSLKLRTRELKGARSGYTGKPQVGYASANSALLLPFVETKARATGAERLGPLGLAVWFMDDGHNSNGLVFSTESFDIETQSFLKTVLKTNFDINVDVTPYKHANGKTYFRLVGGVEEKLKLVEICRPHIHPDLAYKFNTDRNYGICKWCGNKFFAKTHSSSVHCGDVLCRRLQEEHFDVEEVESISDAGERWVYDFTLKSNFNYVSNGYISHNCLDEIDVIKSPAAYAESVNIPTQIRRADGTVQQPLTVLTSTRKSAFGFVQDEIDRAQKTGLKIYHFNILDVTESCKPERHLPNLPKLRLWVSDEELRHLDDAGFNALNNKDKEKFVAHTGFAGCAKCPIFSACKTQLATKQASDSRFLKTIEYTIDRFKHNSIEMAQAQLLCRKPYSEGLIYPRLSEDRHILSPSEAYEKIFGEPPGDGMSPDVRDEFIKNYTKDQLVAALQEHEFRWFGGIDWGSTHNFVYVVGVRVRNLFFWISAIVVAGLEPDQMLEISEPMKRFGATVYGDTADPKMNRLFKKHGHKMVLKWNKGAGTVQGGINVMRAKLNPPLGGDPEMFFVYDLVDEPDLKETFKRLKEYHWKKKPDGTWSNIPEEKDDDPCDGTRYCVMNVFDPKGVLESERIPDTVIDTTETEAPRNWLQDEIQKRVEDPEPNELKGRSGRIMWDLS